MSQSRKRRGRETELLVAQHLRDHGFPHAHATSASAGGVDIDGTPGLAIECKARRGLDLPAWLRQADRNAGGMLPLLVVRLTGQGRETVGQFPVVLTLDQFLGVWHD